MAPALIIFLVSLPLFARYFSLGYTSDGSTSASYHKVAEFEKAVERGNMPG